MKQSWRTFKEWAKEMFKPIVFGMCIGWFITYVYTVDQLVRDCQVMNKFRFNYTSFECKVSNDERKTETSKR